RGYGARSRRRHGGRGHIFLVGCRQLGGPSGYPLMGPVMTDDASETQELLRRAKAGDERALAALFSHYRERLKRMVRLRLHPRLSRRVDASDVLHDAYL